MEPGYAYVPASESLPKKEFTPASGKRRRHTSNMDEDYQDVCHKNIER